MPAAPSSLIEPLWNQFAALLPDRPEFAPDHPLGCHRRRIPDRLVFEHIVASLVHGSGYERIASPGCSDWTIRDRVKQWSALGLAKELHRIALLAYEKMIGLDLDDLAVDGCITKAPARAETAGASPVDRRKQGLKRSTGTDGTGVPLGLAAAGANRHDSKLLAATLQAVNEQVGHLVPPECTVHLDSAYLGKAVAEILEENGLSGEIAQKGTAAPIQATRRWPVERTNSWMNGFGKLRRCCERDGAVVEFYLYLAAAFVTVRALIRRARSVYRWDTRPTTRRLK
ncbi:MAG TPA: IS5 family transposase [Streptosporangiaceae bacterium]|nr:IS5 family transposase [Streptosporangiaceae bacterium]